MNRAESTAQFEEACLDPQLQLAVAVCPPALFETVRAATPEAGVE